MTYFRQRLTSNTLWLYCGKVMGSYSKTMVLLNHTIYYTLESIPWYSHCANENKYHGKNTVESYYLQKGQKTWYFCGTCLKNIKIPLLLLPVLTWIKISKYYHGTYPKIPLAWVQNKWYRMWCCDGACK